MPRKSIDRSTPSTVNVIDMKTGKAAEVPTVPIICERIRHFRERAGIEQKELGRKIGISGNTVSNWERGRSRPDINLIPAICEALQISLEDVFGMPDIQNSFLRNSPAEQRLIDKYRRMKPGNRRIMDAMADDILSIQDAEDTPALRLLRFYQKSLSAGKGDPTEIDGRAMPIYLYRDQFRSSAGTHVSRRADCVFAVNGDSMEPDYHSGDLVLVERIPDAPDLNPGEIGAFIVGNETYIKKYSEEGLVSLNPKYKIMRFDEENSVYLIGRVLGTLDPQCVAASADIEKYRLLHGEEEKEEQRAPGQGWPDMEREVICREYIDRYLR